MIGIPLHIKKGNLKMSLRFKFSYGCEYVCVYMTSTSVPWHVRVCVCVYTKGRRLMPKHLYDTAQSKLHMKVTVLLLLLYYYYFIFILCPTSFLTVNVNKVLSLEILEHSLSSVSRHSVSDWLLA